MGKQKSKKPQEKKSIPKKKKNTIDEIIKASKSKKPQKKKNTIDEIIKASNRKRPVSKMKKKTIKKVK